MFDYFRNIKKRQYEKPDVGLDAKPKKDKVFIAILIVFAVIIVLSLVSNFGKVKDPADNRQNTQMVEYYFNFSIFDGIVLGGAVGGYAFMKIRQKKGRGRNDRT